MKRWRNLLMVLLVIAAAMYSFVYFFIIPKTATFFVPYKWKTIVAGETKENYHIYLGRPVTDTSANNATSDTWLDRKNNYSYVLNMQYNSDTIGSAYSISYTFSIGLFYKSAIILEDSVGNN